MCYLEEIAYLATIVGTLVAIIALVFTYLTYKKASSIEIVVSQKKELFNALTALHDSVVSLRERTDDYVDNVAFKRLLLQCDETKKRINENKYSAGKAEKLIQVINRLIERVCAVWETSEEEEKDLNEVATNLMNKYFSAEFDKTIEEIQNKLK